MIIDSEEITSLLNEWANGSQTAADQLLRLIYPELYRMSAHFGRRGDLTEPVSDLAQELLLRLAGQETRIWANRGHFFATAGRLIRRIVWDLQRKRSSQKRQAYTHPSNENHIHSDAEYAKLDLALDIELLLRRLDKLHPAAAKVVELRYFAGMSVEETAAILEIGTATVKRHWRFARAWLATSLRETGHSQT